MSNVTVVLTTGTGIVSRIIRWFTGSKVSHAAICTVIAGVPVFVHADWGGVQVTLCSAFYRKNKPVEVWCPTFDAEGALASAVRDIGMRYDYVGLLGYAVTMVGRRYGRRLKNPFAGSRATVCSEFVMRIVRSAAPAPLAKLWDAVTPDEVTPDDLSRMFGMAPGLFKRLE